MTTDRADSLDRRSRLLDEWVARERRIAVIQAEQAVLLSDRLDLLAGEPDFDRGGDVSLRSLAAEYAAAAHIPSSTAANRLAEAWMLVHQYPLTLAALQAGRISKRHVDVILTESPEIPEDADADELRREYEAQVVPFAEQDTASRTRAHARGVATALSPDASMAAHRRGRARRSVTVTPAGDGMATLTAFLPEILAHAIKDRLTAQAKQVVIARREAGNSAFVPAPERGDFDVPEVPDEVYEQFLRDIAADEDAAASGLWGDSGDSADEERAPWEDPCASQSAQSAPASDASDRSREPGLDPEPDPEPDSDLDFDPVFIGDFSPLSAAAAEYDLLPPPVLGPLPPDSPPHDCDAPDIDEELEALFAAYAGGFTEEPPPLDPERLHIIGQHRPRGPIGVQETDDRTMDQIRADVLADMLLCVDPTISTRSGLESVRATVQVTISANTLAGHDERPAELDGAGPVEPDWALMM